MARRSRVHLSLSLLALLATLPATEAATTDIPAGVVAAHGLRSDPAPEKITNDLHYLTSNERRLDLFAPSIQLSGDGLGGGYVGVGAGQNYILAGWSRPRFMVLVDFDEDVVDLHQLYTLMFAHAADGAAFEALWQDNGADAVERLVRVGTRSRVRARRLLELYARAQPEIQAHLVKMREKLLDAGQAWYLTDDAQYQHLAALARRDRIVARRGDFTQRGVVAELGEALQAANAQVAVLYLSNIEQYFMYGKDYRANMLGMPLAEASWILRTLPARPAGFEYITQPGADFHAWLKRKRTTSVYRVRGLGRGMHLEASTLFEAGPPPA